MPGASRFTNRCPCDSYFLHFRDAHFCSRMICKVKLLRDVGSAHLHRNGLPTNPLRDGRGFRKEFGGFLALLLSAFFVE